MKKLLRAYFLWKARTAPKLCQHKWVKQGDIIRDHKLIVAVSSECSKCGEWKSFKLVD